MIGDDREPTGAGATTRPAFAWFVIALGVMFFLAVFLYAMLDGSMGVLTGVTAALSPGERADEAARRVSIAWRLWPVWGGLAVLLFGYRRATAETGRR